MQNIEGIRANKFDIAKIDISMKRSLPVDDALLANIAQQTEGFISWETRVKNFDPEIDVEAEKKRLANEKAEKLKEQQKAFGFPYDESDKPNNNSEEGEE